MVGLREKEDTMTTVIVRISVENGDDEYDIHVTPRPKAPLAVTADLLRLSWQVEDAIQYCMKLQNHVLIWFQALLNKDCTTTELKLLAGYKTETEVAGALAWPGRFAKAMDKVLPWAYDGVTVKMLPSVKPVFAEALAVLVASGEFDPGQRRA